MKKRTLLTGAAGVVLAAAFAFGAAGCDKGSASGRFAEPNEMLNFQSALLDDLDGYTVTGIDEEGYITARRTRNNAEIYALYDTNTEEMVTSDYAFTKVTGYDSGLYYTQETVRSSSGSAVTYTYTYTFYDGAEEFRVITQDSSFTCRNGIVSFENGNILYRGLDGDVYYGPREDIDAIPTLANTVEINGYYLMAGSGSAAAYYVYDASGSLISVNKPEISIAGRIPEGENASARWTVDDTVFFQYSYELPADSAEYVYYSNGTKYGVQTVSYNYITGAFAEYDFGYVVQDVAASGEGFAVLSVQSVLSNKLLAQQTFVQAFGEDGGVYSDVQALLPGATDVALNGEYTLITDGISTQIYQNNALVITLDESMDAEWAGYGFLRGVSDPSEFYDLSGTLVYTVPEDASLVSFNENFLYYSIYDSSAYNPSYQYYVYDFETERSTRLDGYASYGNFYVAENNSGTPTLYDREYGNEIDAVSKDAVITSASVAVGNKLYCVVSATTTTSSTSASVSTQADTYLVTYEYAAEL